MFCFFANMISIATLIKAAATGAWIIEVENKCVTTAIIPTMRANPHRSSSSVGSSRKIVPKLQNSEWYHPPMNTRTMVSCCSGNNSNGFNSRTQLQLEQLQTQLREISNDLDALRHSIEWTKHPTALRYLQETLKRCKEKVLSLVVLHEQIDGT
jgi:hypothetical protein